MAATKTHHKSVALIVHIIDEENAEISLNVHFFSLLFDKVKEMELNEIYINGPLFCLKK